ncbi:uncharacterized protein N7479_003452 [Penicillium vulpinum]|uniref:SAP domain-containing protein n=1 Tax=Penicillium vulpinum TaxID=29845 RepID=A0A1V6RWC9_9EURO|nr:uncharacterized protein N7479_003452 [Penicillium vulpinum]KAJ5963576.1 hypothetical protein N7479_003452 [Penicillium vulpinum]OQE06091.1 hypothetical protein PENVUL_c020G08186 [Penicillium vulpinum]
MDLQGTKEARTQEEGAEGPLEAYGAGGGRSKEYHKNEGRDSHNRDDRSSINPLRRRQPPFAYPHGARQSASPIPAVVSRLREPSPSPEAISIPQDLGLSSRDQRLLRKARRSPPVTKKTLSELDLPCIMSNINLRMDANFDRDLHFKPDLDGEKGQRKRKEAADYWDSLAAEITVYSFNAATADSTAEEVESSDGTRRTFDPRLPALFETLQDVIKTLVPERDHPTIMQNLEVPLLMQQIRKGVLDMLTLAKWLAKLLKTHCAPMRDEWADSMVEQIEKGSQSQDPREIVNGLRTLFSILEAMKLDVANHQIRAFRVLLIEDTVPFLQEYFQGKMNRGSFQVEPARHWYLSVREQARLDDANAEAQKTTPIPETEDTLKPLEALFRGISSQLLQFTPPTEFPETFLFDSERLWQLRSTVQNLINLDIAWYIFESYVNKHKRYLSTPEETYSTFRSRIWSLMEDGMDLENRVAGNPDNNDDDPDHRGGKRWTQNMRCIALEIARFACAALQLDPVVADEVIAPIEEALEWHLSNESELFVFFQNSMRAKILATTLAAARRYLPLSPLAICESQRAPMSAAVGPAVPQTGTTNASTSTNTSSLAFAPQQSDVERIGMRLAHMGVLHWRVWAPLLYLRDEIAMVELEQPPLVYRKARHGNSRHIILVPKNLDRDPNATLGKQQAQTNPLGPMRLSAALYSPAHPWLACLKSAQLQRIARATGIQSSGTKGVLIERIAAELTLHSQSQAQLQLQLSAAADRVADGVTSNPNHSTTSGNAGTSRSRDQRVSTKNRPSETKTKTKSADVSKSDPAKQPWSVLSIDMGIQNLAFAHMLVPRSDGPAVGIDATHPRPPVLTAWHRLALSDLSNLNLVPGGNISIIKPAEPISGSADATESSQATIQPIETKKDLQVKVAKSTPKEEDLYVPELYAANAYTLITSLISAYRPTHVLIERQRFRSGGGSAVLEWTLRVGLMEGMLYSVLHTLRQERGGEIADLVVRGIEPKRVVRYWLEGESGPSVSRKADMDEKSVGEKVKEKKLKAREVKKAKIDLVGRWLSTAMQNINSDTEGGIKQLELGIAADNKIVLADKSVSPALHGAAGAYMRKWEGQIKRSKKKKEKESGALNSESLSPSPVSPLSGIEDEAVAVDLGKLDDLADCLLQGVTWVEWQIMRERLVREGVQALELIP